MNKDRDESEFLPSDLLDTNRLVAISYDFIGRYGSELGAISYRFKNGEEVSQRSLSISGSTNILIDRLGETFPEFGRRMKEIDEELLKEGKITWSKNVFGRRLKEWAIFINRLDDLGDLLSE